MRKLAAGFVFGYLTIALLVVPAVLWGFQVTPSYAGGVAMVLDRSGVLAPIKANVDQAAQVRDELLNQFARYVHNKMFAQRMPI